MTRLRMWNEPRDIQGVLINVTVPRIGTVGIQGSLDRTETIFRYDILCEAAPPPPPPPKPPKKSLVFEDDPGYWVSDYNIRSLYADWSTIATKTQFSEGLYWAIGLPRFMFLTSDAADVVVTAEVGSQIFTSSFAGVRDQLGFRVENPSQVGAWLHNLGANRGTFHLANVGINSSAAGAGMAGVLLTAFGEKGAGRAFQAATVQLPDRRSGTTQER